MPWRLDLSRPPADAPDLLIEWGALDLELAPGGHSLAAILPDSVTPVMIAAQFPASAVTAYAATARDGGSVWLLSPRPINIGKIQIAPAGPAAPPGALQLIDADAFGTGHHPSTALCLEVLVEIIAAEQPASVLDVGTGSGILALAALQMGVPDAVGLDIDAAALEAAAQNARLNQLSDRLELILGGPGKVQGAWPLVVANVLAAPLIEMAPALVRLLAKNARLILAGIHSTLAPEVCHAYKRLGIRRIDSQTRDGWTVLTALAPW